MRVWSEKNTKKGKNTRKNGGACTVHFFPANVIIYSNSDATGYGALISPKIDHKTLVDDVTCILPQTSSIFKSAKIHL